MSVKSVWKNLEHCFPSKLPRNIGIDTLTLENANRDLTNSSLTNNESREPKKRLGNTDLGFLNRWAKDT